MGPLGLGAPRVLRTNSESRVNPLFSHVPRRGQSAAGRPSQKSFKDSVIPRDPQTWAAPAPPSWPTPRHPAPRRGDRTRPSDPEDSHPGVAPETYPDTVLCSLYPTRRRAAQQPQPRDPKGGAGATPPSLQIAPLNNTPLASVGFSRLSPSILRHGAARNSRVTQHVQHTSPGRAPHVAPSPTYRRIIDGSEPKLPRARKAP